MPRWILTCPECNHNFTHRKIPDERIPQYDLDAWLDVLFDKPKFPIDGLSLKCPNCNKASLYQQHQLIYRAD